MVNQTDVQEVAVQVDPAVQFAVLVVEFERSSS